jgi:hypothetical protein
MSEIVVKDTAQEYDTAVGVRNTEEGPGSLAELFGHSDIPSSEEEAWKDMWKGMPKYTPVTKVAKTLTINFNTEEDYEKFIELLGYKHITNKTKTVWYPELPKHDRYLTRFVDEDEVQS